jgi:hypothetical protein
VAAIANPGLVAAIANHDVDDSEMPVLVPQARALAILVAGADGEVAAAGPRGLVLRCRMSQLSASAHPTAARGKIRRLPNIWESIASQ